jgi:hypothetical protein
MLEDMYVSLRKGNAYALRIESPEQCLIRRINTVTGEEKGMQFHWVRKFSMV